MEDDKLTSRSSVGPDEELLLYEGIAYNRPLGRGVCIGVDLKNLEDLLPDGYFYIKIEARSIALQ
jgi:hypothetical protein